MTGRTAIFFVLVVCAGAPHAADEDKEMRGQMDALDNAQVVKAGDFLSLQIRKMGMEAFVAPVESDGEFTPPFLPPMKAAGQTCRMLAYAVKREREKSYFCGTQWVLVKFATSQDFMDALNDQQILQPGDKLGVRVLEADRQPVNGMVDKDGTIMVPKLGRVQVQGLTRKKLAHLISQKLAALPPASLSYQYTGAPTVAVIFEVIQPPKVVPMTVPPALR